MPNRVLHITNGDSAAETIAQTGRPGDVLAWRDILHEGPVPPDLSLEELSRVRARFIADQGWSTQEEVSAAFARRDQTLACCTEYQAVILWFEHDLYDQLQLIQLLDWFAQHPIGETRLSLICVGEFPGIDRFLGLGQLDAVQMASLYATRHEVTAAELSLARAAWAAIRSPYPTSIEALLAEDTSALPFLRRALTRHLEQFPAVGSGLSRTERQILEVVASGVHQPVEIFLAEQRQEESPFLGDTTLWWYLRGLGAGSRPLLRRADGGHFQVSPQGERTQAFLDQVIVLTEHGQAVLDGRADWVRLNGLDRWLGGVHLVGQDAHWRWDERRQTLVWTYPSVW